MGYIMQKRIFGRMGWEVSEMSLGTWALGGESYGAVDQEQGIACLEVYTEAGGNFIDTAQAYSDSEHVIGRFLAKHKNRESLIIASKSGRQVADEVRQHLEQSLRSLQTDYIDLYYLHSPPEDLDEMNRLLDCFDVFKEEGKIRAIGASIKGPDVTQKTLDICNQYIDSGRIDAIQLIYSIFRQKNSGIFQNANENGVALVGRTALENGFLSGKYKPGDVFDTGHRTRWAPERLHEILSIVQELKKDLVPPFENMVQPALRFALDQSALATVLVGAKTAEQIEMNMKICTLPSISSDLQTQVAELAEKGDLLNIA